jgi:hypothetical protein
MNKAIRKKLISLKSILLDNQNWWKFFLKKEGTLRESVIDNIIKVMTCKRRCRGFTIYRCVNPECGHAKVVSFTCNGRSCTSCGHKLTQRWIAKQMEILPKTTWQHITLTLPDVFWNLFWKNRWMLGEFMKIGAEIIQSIAEERGLVAGIFIALHTFGRDLKRNVHLHISATCGGLTLDHNEWKKLYYAQPAVMQRWRKAILDWLEGCLYRDDFTPLPSTIDEVSDRAALFLQLRQYRNRYWHVYLQKPSNSHAHNVNYLGRYIKRPPIAESKLLHYDGNEVKFRYLNRKTQQYETKTMDVMTFLEKFTDHIPDRHFRLIRYYGFLANSVRGKLLPIVRHLLDLPSPLPVSPLNWRSMQYNAFGEDPMECILCGSDLIPSEQNFGYATAELQGFHYELANQKPIAC